jgi:proteasome lid subunit RPN8/RPN11
VFDRTRYERAIQQQDEALDRGDMADYYMGRCEQTSAQGRVPRLIDVARAFGLPDPDCEEVATFEDDVVSGRIASGATAEQIRSRLLQRGRQSPDFFPRALDRSWYLGGAADRARGGPSRPSLRPPTRPPGRADRAGGDGEAVELLAANPAAFTISLPTSVQTAIEQEVLAAIWRFDRRDVESGGWLFALYGATDGEVRIAYASGPGANSKHWTGRITLTRPEEIRAAFPDFLRRSQLVLVGDWHSHPVRVPKPSEADLKAWAKHGGLTTSAAIREPHRHAGSRDGLVRPRSPRLPHVRARRPARLRASPNHLVSSFVT